MTHIQHAAKAKVDTPCTAQHYDYRVGCLNCGWIQPLTEPHATISSEVADTFGIPASVCMTIDEPTPHDKAFYAMQSSLEMLTVDGCIKGCSFKETRPHSSLCDHVREALALARTAEEFARGSR